MWSFEGANRMSIPASTWLGKPQDTHRFILWSPQGTEGPCSLPTRACEQGPSLRGPLALWQARAPKCPSQTVPAVPRAQHCQSGLTGQGQRPRSRHTVGTGQLFFQRKLPGGTGNSTPTARFSRFGIITHAGISWLYCFIFQFYLYAQQINFRNITR